jgi:hypothetical protein
MTMYLDKMCLVSCFDVIGEGLCMMIGMMNPPT